MENDLQDVWIIVSAIATMIMAFVIGITIIFHVMTVNTLKSQTFVANFSVITNYTGDTETRKNRRVLYKYYRSQLMTQLLEAYPNFKGEELTLLNESLKQIGAMYERVGFLLQENKELKWKFIEYHGFTMGIMWKIFEPLNTKNIDKEKSKGYSYFQKIGTESYSRWQGKIDEFLTEKQRDNENRKNSEIIELINSFQTK